MINKAAATTDAASIHERAEGSTESVARPAPAPVAALAPIGSGEMFLRLPREMTPPVWSMMLQMADVLVAGGMLPRSIRTPGAAVAIMLKAHELGIPPMQGFAHIHVIEGKPTLSAELMHALILRAFPRLRFRYERNDADGCVIEVARPGGELMTFGFTMTDARNAGVAGKQVWKQYARAMCRSRAISEMARALFPDVLMGCSYTPEELGAAVDVNAEGHVEVIDIQQADAPPTQTAAPAAVPPNLPKVTDDAAPYVGHVEQKKVLAGIYARNGVVATDDMKSLSADAITGKVTMGELEAWVLNLVHPEPEATDGLGKPLAPGEKPLA